MIVFLLLGSKNFEILETRPQILKVAQNPKRQRAHGQPDQKYYNNSSAI